MMRPLSLLQEAWLNVRSGTTKAGLFSVLAALLGSTLIIADAAFIQQLSAAAEMYQAAGASTQTVIAEGRVDGEGCTALSQISGVQAAGAIRKAQSELEPAALPSSSIPYFETTPGFGVLLGTSANATGGLLISDQVAQTLQLSTGDTIAIRRHSANQQAEATSSPAEVGGTYAYPDDGRVSGYGYAVLAETAATNDSAGTASEATKRFDECWVRMWPESASIRSQLTGVVITESAEEAPPALSKLNNSLGDEFSGRAQFEDRITRFAPAVGVLVGVGIGFVAVRFRRIHLASALHAGMRRRDLAVMLGLEQVLWGGLSCLILVNVAAWCAFYVSSEDRTALFALGTSTAAALYLGTFLGATLAFGAVKEQALFQYFKEGG